MYTCRVLLDDANTEKCILEDFSLLHLNPTFAFNGVALVKPLLPIIHLNLDELRSVTTSRVAFSVEFLVSYIGDDSTYVRIVSIKHIQDTLSDFFVAGYEYDVSVLVVVDSTLGVTFPILFKGGRLQVHYPSNLFRKRTLTNACITANNHFFFLVIWFIF